MPTLPLPLFVRRSRRKALARRARKERARLLGQDNRTLRADLEDVPRIASILRGHVEVQRYACARQVRAVSPLRTKRATAKSALRSKRLSDSHDRGTQTDTAKAAATHSHAAAIGVLERELELPQLIL